MPFSVKARTEKYTIEVDRIWVQRVISACYSQADSLKQLALEMQQHAGCPDTSKDAARVELEASTGHLAASKALKAIAEELSNMIHG